MEESQELPECPVCLQTYDGECTIPRVLACGHTVCESCLVNLPKKLPGAIRCPACTVLVKYPPEGPATLPKNIDLLRLIPASENPRKPNNKLKIVSHVAFLPRSWSDEFYSNWKNYILREDAVERNKTSLLPVGYFSTGGEDDYMFNTEYLVRVMDCLREMKEDEREELGLVLRTFTKQSCRICRILGLWGDLGDGVLYLVSERQKCGSFLDKNLGSFEKDDVFNFAMIGMEMCEAVISLHREGLIAGCLSFDCFQFDDFGHIYIDLNQVFLTGRGIQDVFNVGFSGKKNGDEEIGILFKDLLKRDVFVSREVLLKLLDKKCIGVESSSSRYSIGYSSDAWLLSCIMLRIVNGEVFSDELVDYMCHILMTGSENSEIDCLNVYTSFLEKVSLFETIFGIECLPLQQVVCKCLDLDPDLDPKHRSRVRDVWKCIRELVIKPQFDKLVKLDGPSYDENGCRCLVVGKLCLLSKEMPVKQEKEEYKEMKQMVQRTWLMVSLRVALNLKICKAILIVFLD